MPLFRSILVVDDEASIRHVLTLVLNGKGYDVRAVSDGQEALKELAARSYDVVISDVRMPNLDGLSLLKTAHQQWPDITFIVMSAYGTQEQALAAVNAGAYDYVSKPFRPEEVVLVIQKAEERLRLLRENRRLREHVGGAAPLDRIIGASVPIQNLRKQIQKVAPATTTVLVSGESGTGKELVARALHELSSRSAMAFVPVNCGAIPEGLIESELFGHARGAFTDAKTAKRGLIAEAHGGTLFLDEIGELPLTTQVKLLRFLQEGEIKPVGENRSEKVDVRVVAATLRDLNKQVQKGVFREDLYFRLNVINLHVPSLRERRGDIVTLAESFIGKFSRQMNREGSIKGFAPETVAMIEAYAWPGNVRELENAMERAVLLAEGEWIVPAALPEKIWSSPRASDAKVNTAEEASLSIPEPDRYAYSLKRATQALEESFIRAALKKTKGNRTKAAELLEISHRALLYKLKDYSIDADATGES